MRQFTRGCACPICYHAQGIQSFLDSPSHTYSKCLGSAQLLFRPQRIPPAPARIPMLRVGIFLVRHEKGRIKLYCLLISLALLADKREKGQWWSLWAHASFHLWMFAVPVPQPWSSPCPCLCYIQSFTATDSEGHGRR